MKKNIGLSIFFMVMILSLSSCTLGGAPLTLLGTWETDTVGYFHFTGDDAVYYGLSTNNLARVGTITKCTCNEMTIKLKLTNKSDTCKYELTGDKLLFNYNNTEFVCKKLKDVGIGLID